VKLKVKRLASDAKLPTLAYNDPAGYDLYANEHVTVGFHQIRKVGTGLAMEIPEGYVGIIKERASTPEMGFLIHSGVIDSDWRGEVQVVVSLNQYGRMWGAYIDKGQKIAQMVILKKFTPAIIEVDALSGTKRGKRGFGSSDIG